MSDRMQVFSREELNRIHDASLDILGSLGVQFNSKLVLDLFRRHGFKLDGTCVFFSEKEVMEALEQTPSRFRVYARNPAHNVSIGQEDFVFLPTGGAPNVTTLEGELRPATLADFADCCRLVQTSDQLDMNGALTVQPNDLPPESAHLDVLLQTMLLCDKAYVGTAMHREAAMDCLDMAALAWGGLENLKKQPVMTTIISVASPLQYATDEGEAIMAMAVAGQPLVITDLVMAGTSGPISLPSLLALANAEILAGIVLAQLAGPGVPVVYGSVSAPSDMRTVTSAVGAPEAVVLASAVTQLAQYYHLPCRTGGMLTNAHSPDAQATAEGTLMLSTAVRNGANFILHACGQLGSYISMSFEKWLIDEEVCRTLRRVLSCMQIDADSIDLETIKQVGIKGNYLLHPTTFNHCRDLYRPELFTRSDYAGWRRTGAKRVDKEATEQLVKRLTRYQRPAIDTGLEQTLNNFVQGRKSGRIPAGNIDDLMRKT